LDVQEGEFIVVTGNSGGGKSTLAFLLAGFIPHLIGGDFKGEILYQGINTNSLTLGEISQLIGLVQQDPENQIITSTVLEEIAFGPENLNLSKTEINKRITESLIATNLNDLLYRSTNELSGGEKQRVALASILAMGGKIIILDEPTAFLDYESKNLLLSTLKDLNLNKRQTVIVIDHQPEIYKDLLTRLVVLDQGVIVEDNQKASVDYSKFNLSMDDLSSIQSLPIKQPITQPIDIKQLTVTLQNSNVLRNISLTLKSGLVYGLVGPNGSGKTTLAQTLLNLHRYKGEILINNENISEVPTYQLAKTIGLIFQNPNHQLFEQTVLKEMLFAPKNLMSEEEDYITKANQFLNDALLIKYSNLPPFGLSYGEKRRLNICSSEIYSPEVLILDEPFIGQDLHNFTFILNILMERKKKGQTSIIISHRDELVQLVDYLYVLKNGELINQGKPQELEFLGNNDSISRWKKRGDL
jgi:energy-coupling factor transport system ATP-binding protein